MSGSTGFRTATALDFARLSHGIYGDQTGGRPPANVGTWSIANSSPDTSFAGFKGALYQRGNGRGVDIIATICGTEIGPRDLITDAGFDGVGIGLVISPATWMWGKIFLRNQANNAIALAERAKSLAAAGGHRRAFITGHSLGGGLAQIAAAYSGLRAVTFNPAAATGAFSGIAAQYRRGGGSVVNFQVEGDPINQTSGVGDFLGDRILLGRHERPGAMDCHSIEKTVQQMSIGCFQGVGGIDPFRLIGRDGLRIAPNSSAPA